MNFLYYFLFANSIIISSSLLLFIVILYAYGLHFTASELCVKGVWIEQIAKRKYVRII